MDLLPRILIAALFAFIFATGFYALTSWIHESLASFVAFLTLFPAFLFGLFLPEIISFIRFILSLAGTLLRLLGFPLP